MLDRDQFLFPLVVVLCLLGKQMQRDQIAGFQNNAEGRRQWIISSMELFTMCVKDFVMHSSVHHIQEVFE